MITTTHMRSRSRSYSFIVLIFFILTFAILSLSNVFKMIEFNSIRFLKTGSCILWFLTDQIHSIIIKITFLDHSNTQNVFHESIWTSESLSPLLVSILCSFFSTIIHLARLFFCPRAVPCSLFVLFCSPIFYSKTTFSLSLMRLIWRYIHAYMQYILCLFIASTFLGAWRLSCKVGSDTWLTRNQQTLIKSLFQELVEYRSALLLKCLLSLQHTCSAYSTQQS